MKQFEHFNNSNTLVLINVYCRNYVTYLFLLLQISDFTILHLFTVPINILVISKFES